jgi:O-antigen/teichoic acid export membrane protein
VLIEVANLASVLILARLIGPEETGEAAVALVFPMLAVILTFEGFGGALVQREDITRGHLRTAMTLSLVSGALLSVLVGAVGVFFGPSIFGAKTADLIVLVSPVFLISSTGCVSRALLMRDLRFRLMSRRDSSVLVITSALTVAFAYAGLRASSFVYGALIGAALDAFIMILSAPPQGVGWNAEARRDILRYGVSASTSGLVIALRRNIDYLILGAVMPSRITGIYYRSFQFGAEYQNKVSAVFVMMLFPLLSRSVDQSNLRLVRQRSMTLNALVALPLLGLVVALAPQLVFLLYGPAWHSAVTPTRILAIAGMAQALLAGFTAVPLSLGRTSLLLKVQSLFLIVYGLNIYAASHFGLNTICWTAVAVFVIMLILIQHVCIDRLLDLPTWQILADVGPAVVGTAVCVVAAYGASQLVGSWWRAGTALPDLAIVASASLTAVVAYLLVLRFLFPGTWRLVASMGASILRARGTAA